MNIRLPASALLTLILATSAHADEKTAKNPSSTPAALEVGGGGRLNPDLKTDPKAMQEFLDWRFGMFIHWGPVALKGAEIGWSRGKQVPVEEYDNLYKKFNPEKYDADAWVSAAADAGMKYIVFTCKHHDGFCLWPSKFTDYTIAATPWKGGKGDVVKELAEACKKHGVRFCAYYTVADWYHYDWLPRFQDSRPTDGADPARFDKYMRDQLGEIIRDYDPALIWFDGNWSKEWTRERGESLYADLRKMKPDLLINNRVDSVANGVGSHKVLTPGFAGDYATPEQFIGPYAAYPWETCALITTQQWAWKPNDPLKTYEQTMDHLFRCAGGNGNLLLNIGPRADGAIEPAQVARLHEIGEWMKKYGESIYGTRGGPWLPVNDKVSTFRGNTAYVHLLAGQGEVFLPSDGFTIKSAKLLTGGELTLVREDGGVRITIPESARNPLNILIKLELDCPVGKLPVRSFFPKTFSAVTASNLFQNNSAYAAEMAADGDPATRWATDAGTKTATLEAVLVAPRLIKGVRMDEEMGERVAKWRLSVRVDGAWKQVAEGGKIGSGRNVSFDPVKAEALRLDILDASDGPSISEFTPNF